MEIKSTNIASIPFTILHKSGETMTIAYYVALKRHYINGTKVNLQALSKTIGCSENSLRTHLGILEKHGFLTRSRSEKGLYINMKSTNALAGKTEKWSFSRELNRYIKVKRNQFLSFKGDNVKEIKKEVDSLFLTANISNQAKATSHTNNCSSYTGISCVALAKKKGKKSASTGYRIAQKAIELGKIVKTNRFEDVGAMTAHELSIAKSHGYMPQHSFIKEGRCLVQKHNEYTLQATKTTNYTPIPTFSVIEKQIPFYIDRPKGYFNKNYLRKLKFSAKDIKIIFQTEIISTYRAKNSVNSKNVDLMSFDSLHSHYRFQEIQQNRE